MRDGIITMVAVIIAFLALDDITTDIDRSFLIERAALILCACWFVVVAWRIWRRAFRSLGGLSLVMALTAAVIPWTIGPATTPSLKIEYLLTVFELVWFAGLAVIVAVVRSRKVLTH